MARRSDSSTLLRRRRGYSGYTDLICNAHRLPFADQVFEAVIALNAFEHYSATCPPQHARSCDACCDRAGAYFNSYCSFSSRCTRHRGISTTAVRYGLEAWFEDFETEKAASFPAKTFTLDIHWLGSLPNANLHYAARIGLGCRRISRRALTPRLVSLWRMPEGARTGEPVWNSLAALPFVAQEGFAAGFELIGRKLPV